MERDRVRITSTNYDTYFSICVWGKSGKLCDTKVKEKHNDTTKENEIDE